MEEPAKRVGERGAGMEVRIPLLGVLRGELEGWMEVAGEASYRARQVIDWAYGKRVEGWDEMANLPKRLRERLAAAYELRPLELVMVKGAQDSTRKYLWKLGDGRMVETVLIPANPDRDGERCGRMTLCVSSQVGCAYGCVFCASGLAGFKRNLVAGEIVAQLTEVERHSGQRVDNVVFMGMGEPLANLREVGRAVEILNAEWGVGLGARHITLSTSGLAPQIEKLAERPEQIRLAISLHGATDEVRGRIMPVNQRYPLERLFRALEVWGANKKQRVTFEYILIEGVNDGLDQAEQLMRRARKLRAKVNLIPYNTVERLAWRRPEEGHCRRFREVLAAGGVTATLRLEKGHDIEAACGQLSLIESER
jgi:23S rRNA (adenine2503-C2)-methyltransferase